MLGFLTHIEPVWLFGGCLGVLGGKIHHKFDLKLCWDNFCVFLLNSFHAQRLKKRQKNEQLINGLHNYQEQLVILQEQVFSGIFAELTSLTVSKCAIP